MKVCFVGIGSIARRHIRNLCEICEDRKIDLRIDAYRRSEANLADTPDIIENIFTDIDSLPTDYDIVFLTNPTEYHVDTLMKMHDHGRHFFIEKPIASLGTVDKLDHFNFRKDSVYYVACPMRYTNVIRYIKEKIEPDTVYAVRSISSSYLPDWRPGIDYRNTYSAHKDLGGGVDIDLIHEWDYLTYLFGMPSSVKNYSGKVSELEIDSSDYAIYIARYGNRMIAELHLDYFGRNNIRIMELFTNKDTIHADFLSGSITYLCSGEEVKLPSERDLSQKRELQAFLDDINIGNCFRNDIRNAVRVLKLTQGIVEP